jgi:HD superfamily phosphohydrolase
VANLHERVNTLVEWLFAGHRTCVPRGPKVINDALLGNQYFAKHEVAVLNCPLLQRLKRVKQTGLVFQVFPSATHSRFEHCLGVVTLAERCFNAILDRTSVETPGLQVAVPDRIRGDLAHLRMAALLHDVGHGMCSHASEQIYESLSDLRELRLLPSFTKNQPGEILSHLMVTSPFFRNWFNTYINGACGAAIDLDIVAQMILGKHPDPDRYFLAQIISSPYDADKLDYIARDSYYCGLALTVDLPRFYSMIATTVKYGMRILVLRSYVPLEQILFSKMTLFGSVYHHQKVKCLDSMLRSTIKYIHDQPENALSVRDGRVSFSEPTEYLYLTDDEFFYRLSQADDEYLRGMSERFFQRSLFVRCLEISRRTVPDWEQRQLKNFVNLASRPKKLHALEESIYGEATREAQPKCRQWDVLLSVPKPPNLKNDYAFIQSSVDSPADPIEDYFPLEQWTDSYAHNKWRGFVYGPLECATAIRDAALTILADKSIGVSVDRKRSNQACHLPD